MRILNVSGFDIVGPLANGYLLHREYLKRGIESQMAVWKKGDLSDPTIHELRDGASNYVNFASVFLEKKLSLYSVLPAAGFQLYFKPYYRNADIVHLHLPHVTSFFSIFNFPLMGSDKRHHVVLNVHDMFFMTGLCHYSLECDRWMTGCGHCPDLSRSFPVRRDTTAFMWKLKKWAFERTNATLIVGSDWQLEHLKRSPILSHLPYRMIPYAVDTNYYRLQDKATCRAKLGIPVDAKVIAFRFVASQKNMKGIAYIERALASLDLGNNAYIIALEGKGGLDSLRGKYLFRELGWVNDPKKIAIALGAADIFLMPSTAEAFGLMAVESMACGTPVIVFEGTALPKTIHAPLGGLAVPRDADALASAILELLTNESLRQAMSNYGVKIVKQDHTLDLYVSRHLDLYRELIQYE